MVRMVSLRYVLLAAVMVFRLTAAPGPKFIISFSSAQSTHPLDGRLLLLLSNDPSQEARMQINDTPTSQIVFGINVDGLAPGASAVIDASATGYPVQSLSAVPSGEYTVQAVLDKYETFHRADGKVLKLPMDRGEGRQWNLAAGNLYSQPMKLTLNAKGS